MLNRNAFFHLCTTLVFSLSAAAGDAPEERGGPAPGEAATTLLPEGNLFDPLLADIKEPRFFISFHSFETSGQLGEFTASSVAYGEKFGFARWRLAPDKALQLGIAGGVFAQFNLDRQSKDLINADYTVGLRLSYRDGLWSYRARLFHQSTHLGDEFLLENRDTIERINFSIESMDITVSRDWSRWRLYGGLGRVVSADPSSFKRDYALSGAEYRLPPRFDLMSGQWLVGLHLQALEHNDWAVGKSLKMGLGFGGKTRRENSVKLMLEAYKGYMPFGQFYDLDLESVGAGLYFGF